MAPHGSGESNEDDRVRQLLDPKAYRKQKSTDSRRPSTTPKSGNSKSSNSRDPHRRFPPFTDALPSKSLLTEPSRTNAYNPRLLLDPKSPHKTRIQPSSNNPSVSNARSEMNLGSSDLSAGDRENPFHLQDEMNDKFGLDRKHALDSDGPGSHKMLENIYNVERRVDQPMKKVRRETIDDEQKPTQKASHGHHNNGVIGQYLKSDPEIKDTTGPNMSQVVDLTTDDNDDLMIIGERDLGQKEVCYGQVYATVLAHLIPASKANLLFYTINEWPISKCKLERDTNRDQVIKVIDSTGRYFGNISSEVSVALAPAIDKFPSLRTQARILNRRKKTGEMPGQPCSDLIKMTINIYGLKRDGVAIGKFFGHHNVWFMPPLAPDKGIEICNPHQRSAASLGKNQNKYRMSIQSSTRTNEEIANDVEKLFDHFASDAALLPTTEPPATIITPLLEHQKQALTFLLSHEKPRNFGPTEAENSSLWRMGILPNGDKVYKEVVAKIETKVEPEQVFGGLLADVMGLGKTIEALSLIAATTDEADLFGKEKLDRKKEADANFLLNAKTTLIVSPLSAVKNWEDQIAEHIAPDSLRFCVYHGPNRTQNAFEISKYDIVITTYGTVASEISGRSSKGTASPIRQLKWFRIILDEAHTIREQRAAQSQAIYSLWAQRRWCLTGTPIQNRIDDLGSLTRFLRLFPYDTAAGFNQYIRMPMAGDPSFLTSLRVFIDSFTLRRNRDRVDLPNREDLIETLEFSVEEQRLHDFFKEQSHLQLEAMTQKKDMSGKVQHHVLQSILTLRLISAHGRELLNEKDLERLRGISAMEAIDLDEVKTASTITKRVAFETLHMMEQADLDMCRVCDKRISGDSPQVEADTDSVRCYILPCFDLICKDCFDEYKESFDGIPDETEVTCPFCHQTIASQCVAISGEWVESIETILEESAPTPSSEPLKQQRFYGGPHTKTRALLRDIELMKGESLACTLRGEAPVKCVVFSEFTSHLDLIGRALEDCGYSYVRIDGTMSLNKRRKVLDALNEDDNVTILLASIKAAGQGLNLTAASWAFIMEPMWNPASETQAVDRIYRIGQKRDVRIKRFHMAKSIELQILQLQKKKQALADVSMNRNHKQLSKKETREQHYKEILSLFK